MQLWLIFLPLGYGITMFFVLLSKKSWKNIFFYGLGYFFILAVGMLCAIWLLAN